MWKNERKNQTGTICRLLAGGVSLFPANPAGIKLAGRIYISQIQNWTSKIKKKESQRPSNARRPLNRKTTDRVGKKRAWKSQRKIWISLCGMCIFVCFQLKCVQRDFSWKKFVFGLSFDRWIFKRYKSGCEMCTLCDSLKISWKSILSVFLYVSHPKTTRFII